MRLRTILAILFAFAALAACGGAGGEFAVDPPGSGDDRPPAVPAAPGTVHTRTLATVMDTGKGAPEICLGAVAESYPPQCGGPELVGWDWTAQHGVFEQQGAVRWGQFAVSGTWDGERLTVTDAVPAALYDAAPAVEPTYPAPARQLGQADLDRVQAEVDDLPFAQGSYVMEGHVFVDVAYDDGSLQAWADRTWGKAVVVVTGGLVDGE